MARLLYWLLYNVDLGPFGPQLMDFAVKTWLRTHRAKVRRDRIVWAMTPAWTHR